MLRYDKVSLSCNRKANQTAWPFSLPQQNMGRDICSLVIHQGNDL